MKRLYHLCINCEASSACSLERRKLNESFSQLARLMKELKIFLYSVDKKEDVLSMFTDWFRQEFDLPVDSPDFKRNVELCVF